MERKYLVWHDPHCNGVDPQWDELTGPEFYALVSQPENKHRLFIRLGNDVDLDADILTVEATPEEYRLWMREQRRKTDRRKRSKGVELLSLDYLLRDADGDEDLDNEVPVPGDVSLEDMEEQVLNSVLKEQINKALEKLPEKDRILLDQLYRTGLTMKEAGKIYGVPLTTIQYRRDNALRRLRQYL